jgi:hypothetical protein
MESKEVSSEAEEKENKTIHKKISVGKSKEKECGKHEHAEHN